MPIYYGFIAIKIRLLRIHWNQWDLNEQNMWWIAVTYILTLGKAYLIRIMIGTSGIKFMLLKGNRMGWVLPLVPVCRLILELQDLRTTEKRYFPKAIEILVVGCVYWILSKIHCSCWKVSVCAVPKFYSIVLVL